MIKKIFLLVCFIFSPQIALADNDNIRSVIDAFTNCDNSFFDQLKTNAKDFEDNVDLVIKDDIAYIAVKNVENPEDSTHYFKQPIDYRGLTITGYRNIYIETPFLGQYYYWGFIINGSVDHVKQSLNQLPWQAYNETSYIANAQLYDRQLKNSRWQNNPYTINGVIPRSFTAEKSLYLEPDSQDQVQLFCSIQGDMSKELLYSIHPDMQYIDQEIDVNRQEKMRILKEKRKQQRQSNTQTNNTIAVDKEL